MQDRHYLTSLHDICDIQTVQGVKSQAIPRVISSRKEIVKLHDFYGKHFRLCLKINCEQSLIFLLSHSSSKVCMRGERRSREQRGRNAELGKSFPLCLLLFTPNLYNFNFSLATRGSEGIKTTTRSRFN